ncbi:MAG: type IV secretion system DNA-binding domain-containing protein [Thermoplasmata archaeon]
MVKIPYNFFEIKNLENIPDGHGAIFGKTGAGKTSLLYYIAKKITEKNETLIILDPHGDLSKSLIFKDKTIFISPLLREINGKNYAIKMNLMDLGREKNELSITTITETLKLLFSMDLDYSQGTWGPRLETIFSSIIPEIIRKGDNVTLTDVVDALIYKNISEDNRIFPIIKGRNYIDYIQSTINKILPVVENYFLRIFLASKNTSFSFFRDKFDGKILDFYLAKPELGEFISRMAGSAVLAMIMNAIVSKKLGKITLIIDEIKDFSPYLLPSLFSESRKFQLRIIIAAQYVNQLNRDLYDSIMGNVSWIAAFRVSPEDASKLAKKFSYDYEKIERTLISLPEQYFLMKNGELNIYNIKNKETYYDEQTINDSYIKFGSIIDIIPENLLSMIYSMIERGLSTNFSIILREYTEIFNKDVTTLEASLRTLLLNGYLIYKDGFYRITEKGIRNMLKLNLNGSETIYHNYLVKRSAEYFKALGFEIYFSRLWKNEPDLIVRKENLEFYIEAEYGDLKSPGKIINHLIDWKNKRIIFVTFNKFVEKLFRILCMPAIVDESFNIKLYKNNGYEMDYKKAGNYSKNVWIVISPEPGTLGSLMKYSFNGIKILEISDLYKSNLFEINGENIFDIFGNELIIEKDGKFISRLDFIKEIRKL